MVDQLITKETAILAKKKGFDVSSLNQYRLDTNGNFEESYHGMIVHDHIVEIIKRPTQSLLQRWLREVHKIDLVITISEFSRTYGFKLYYINNGTTECINERFNKFETYEEALEIGLQKALELL